MTKNQVVERISNKGDNYRVFAGSSFKTLIDKIEEKYPEQYRFHDQREQRQMPFFWKKEYEIEIEITQGNEKRKGTNNRKADQVTKQRIDNVLQDMENGSLQEKMKSNANKWQPEKQQLQHVDELVEQKLREKEEALKKEKEEEMQKMKEEYEKREKDINQKLETVMNKVVNTINEKENVTKEYLGEDNQIILKEVYIDLIDKEIEDRIAKKYMERVMQQVEETKWNEKEMIETNIQEYIANDLRVIGKLDYSQIKIQSLVGPTGVGKTTTIAKIAANLKRDGKKIGFITTDTFRIGASFQLEVYANILDSKMYEASSKEELEEKINKLLYEDKVDHVLIDTVGRNPLDVGLIDDINGYLEVAQPDHVSLVLSSTMKTKDAKKIIQNFKQVTLDSLIFTKLDETMNHGLMLNVTNGGRIPISHVTNGQQVPNDIHIADSKQLAQIVMNGVETFEK